MGHEQNQRENDPPHHWRKRDEQMGRSIDHDLPDDLQRFRRKEPAMYPGKGGEVVAMKSNITIEQLRGLFKYCPETGIITNSVRRHTRAKQGQEAGSKTKRGYRKINIDGKTLFSHRVAWAIFYGSWPDGEIDHLNGNGQDNSIKNLRIASRAENSMNRRTPKQNTSGYKGVTWNKARKRWQAQISANRKTIYLGRFDRIEEAASAYKSASKRLHGRFAKMEGLEQP